ncbi:MAG: cell division protein FtsH [Pirellulales bacterium]
MMEPTDPTDERSEIADAAADEPAEATPEDVATAYHEAGHAAIALILRRPIERVSIEPNQVRLGHCTLRKSVHGPMKDSVETEILILLGGIGAEARHTGDYNWEAASDDMRTVRRLLEMRSGNDRQLKRTQNRLLDKAEHLLDEPGMWTAIERIAAELLRYRSVSGRGVRHIFEQAIRLGKKRGE